MRSVFLAASALVVGIGGCHAGGADDAADGAPRGSLGSTLVLGGDGGAAAQVVATLREAGGPNQVGLEEALVQKMLNPSNLPPYNGPTGSVEGTVWITGEPSPARPSQPTSKCPEAAALYAKLFREGPANDKGARPLADAIVGVNDPPGPSTTYLPAATSTVTATIEGCTLGTRTVALTFGQRLDVANHGTKLAGPKLIPSGVVALMLAPPHGDPVHLYPTKPGRYLLGDALSTEAIDADVFVFLFPLHVVTPESGHFRIDGIPVGRRRVFAHLPAIDSGNTSDVDVRAGETTPLDLTLHYDATRPVPAVSAPLPPTNPVR